jgi:hypothetical protein
MSLPEIRGLEGKPIYGLNLNLGAIQEQIPRIMVNWHGFHRRVYGG